MKKLFSALKVLSILMIMSFAFLAKESLVKADVEEVLNFDVENDCERCYLRLNTTKRYYVNSELYSEKSNHRYFYDFNVYFDATPGFSNATLKGVYIESGSDLIKIDVTKELYSDEDIMKLSKDSKYNLIENGDIKSEISIVCEYELSSYPTSTTVTVNNHYYDGYEEIACITKTIKNTKDIFTVKGQPKYKNKKYLLDKVIIDKEEVKKSRTQEIKMTDGNIEINFWYATKSPRYTCLNVNEVHNLCNEFEFTVFRHYVSYDDTFEVPVHLDDNPGYVEFLSKVTINGKDYDVSKPIILKRTKEIQNIEIFYTIMYEEDYNAMMQSNN